MLQVIEEKERELVDRIAQNYSKLKGTLTENCIPVPVLRYMLKVSQKPSRDVN